MSAADGDIRNRRGEVGVKIRIKLDNSIIRLSLLNDGSRGSRATNGCVISGNVEVADQIISRKSFHDTARDVELVGSRRHDDSRPWV